MERFTGVLGLLTMIGLAWLFSTDRKSIRLKTVLWGLGLQIAFAIFVLRVNAGRDLFQWAGQKVNALLGYAFYGSQFVFGELGLPSVGNVNFPTASPQHFIFAFQVLPTIIFIAAFFALLYHIGVMQLIIRVAAWIMTRVMGASGAESLNVAASIFMGQTEAPLTIRPFLNKLTKSELMVVMTSGMAHVSGGIMAAYIAFGIKAEHLLTAVIMTAPGTLLMAKMLVPETEQPLTAGRVEMPEMEKESNFLGAISRGTVDGLHLALNVGAMLISFIALLYLVNALMGGAHDWFAIHPRLHMAWFPSSLQQIFGWIFAPVAWVIGIHPWKECLAMGNLLGTRMVINEVVAFQNLGQYINAGLFDPRNARIATFALCGFANFSSIGIQIGGIGALAPEQRGQLAKFGIRAMLAGTMANLMSASIVGILS
jgi:CNT family concentrative nucleoside transporter